MVSIVLLEGSSTGQGADGCIVSPHTHRKVMGNHDDLQESIYGRKY